MSNQIVISSGAKVRSLEGVLTGTAGIVNSVPLGGANGVATLDSMGKVPLSQLPASVVTYLGTWNAATNTPTLTNGVGDVGDLYICNVAGTVNFGAGPITFAVGDWVIYNGSQWQKSSGASGTVTSVAVTESGNALTITGSPITTSGTINIGFAGTGSQYIKGDGTLATFPTTIDQAKRLITEVYNSTGATLSKGTVVYINGGQGNLPTVTKAQANADNTSAQTYGVVQSDITNMNNGFVVVFGSLTDLDTQAYAVGTQLYLSGTTAGAWTSTKPSAPIHLVYVGIVVRSHPTQGVVEIRIQNGYELEELHDVAISAPVNNQGIFYNSSNDLWENKSIATALGYTPANDALVVHLAGTETITGSKIFSAAITADAGISLKEGVVPSAVGYTGLAGDADGLLITKRIGTTAYTNLFYFQAIDASNTYTFPNLTGTLALLEGTQTFTGDKTFNGGVDFNNALNINNTFNLRNNLVGSTLYTNFSILKSGSLQTLTYLFSTANSSKLVFNDAANYTYTFPTTSGTLALTSNLSSYVPYTGATAAVNLGSNALTALTLYSNAGLALSNSGQFTGGGGYTGINGRTDGIDIRPNNGGIFQFIFSNTTNRTYTLPDATGTIVLGTGTTNYIPKFTGASTIGNSLLSESGNTLYLTSASSAATIFTSAGSANYSSLSFINSTTGYGYDVGFGGSTSIAPNSFYIYGGSSASVKFQISSAGDFNLNGKTYINGTPSITTNYQFFVKRATDRNLGIGLQGGDLSLEFVNDAISANVPTRIYANPISFWGGNVGINISPVSTTGTTRTMQIGASTIMQSVVNTQSIYGDNAYYDGSGWKYATSNNAAAMRIGALSVGEFTFHSAAYATAGSSITNWDSTDIKMSIKTNGAVLLGTLTDVNATRLQVAASGGTNWISGTFAGTGNTDKIVIGNLSSYGPTIGGHNATLTAWAAMSINPGGGAVYAGTQRIDNNSDIRVKKNIQSIENALDVVLCLDGRKFNMIDEDNILRYGFIAQEVQPHLSDFVTESTREYKDENIHFENLLTLESSGAAWAAILVEAIKELSAKVTALENKS